MNLLERVKAARPMRGPPAAHPGRERAAARRQRQRQRVAKGAVPVDREHDEADIERQLRELFANPPRFMQPRNETATRANAREENARRQARYYKTMRTQPLPMFSYAEMCAQMTTAGLDFSSRNVCEPAPVRRPRTLAPAHPMKHGCDYLKQALHEPDVILSKARMSLEGRDFDTIIGRGMSGALVVPWLARALGKHWAVVRKENDGSHSGYMIEGYTGERYVFVDDLICSGETLSATLATLRQEFAKYGCQPPECVGAFLYTYDTRDCFIDPASDSGQVPILNNCLRADTRRAEQGI